MATWKLGLHFSCFQQKQMQILQTLTAEVSQLPAVHAQDGFVEARKQLQALARDLCDHCATVLRITTTFDEPAFFQAIEQTSHIRIARNHSIGNVAACEPIRRSTEDSKDVVLCRRKVFFF